MTIPILTDMPPEARLFWLIILPTLSLATIALVNIFLWRLK